MDSVLNYVVRSYSCSMLNPIAILVHTEGIELPTEITIL